MKYITHTSDIPKGTHFAVLVSSSIYIPGDERSQSCPGHGYPAENKSIVECIIFDSEHEMLGWVEKQESTPYRSSRRNYQIIKIEPLEVQVKVSVV